MTRSRAAYRKSDGLTRREFLCGIACAGACVLSLGGTGFAVLPGGLQEASYYRRTGRSSVACDLCPNSCTLRDEELSPCRTRLNRNGKLYAVSYDSVAAIHQDPISKGPLYHFRPEASTLSIATAGCNLHCLYCQNWELSQKSPQRAKKIGISQADLVGKALRSGCRAVTFTYTEPVAYYEYMVDVARRAKGAGLSAHMVTAAYINRLPLENLCGCIDAATVSIKGFDDPFYREICGGRIEPVLEAARTLKKAGVWLEIATCIVPGRNDSTYEMSRMVKWIRDSLGRETPFHIERFVPEYKLTNLPPTPITVMEGLRKAALEEGLQYVYISNMPGHEGNNTYCPSCGKSVITRLGFKLINNHLRHGRCPHCGTTIPGVWS